MAVINLSKTPSLINQYIMELRDVQIQQDRMRFRTNLRRIGQLIAYEISKELEYVPAQVETPLGIADMDRIKDFPVLATILRAGLPLHEGFLDMFDHSDNAFVSAYRLHHPSGDFEINVEYVSSPSVEDKVLIVCDPMIATGASAEVAIRELLKHGQPKQLHIVGVITSSDGIEHLERHYPRAKIWACAIDEELTAKSYIVPGLGDAGDLAFGSKKDDEH